jgi:solute carrier family 25 carnitine/acylcarnitine transporter 20/29
VLSYPVFKCCWVAQALSLGASSFTIYSRTKEHFAIHDILCRNNIFDAALTGGISGAMSGALISFASARVSFLSLRTRQVLMLDWKRLNSSRLDPLLSVRPPTLSLLQVRRQLEYTIAATKGISLVKPPGTLEAVKEIYRVNGTGGLYTGFRLHFREFFCLVFATSSINSNLL